MSGFTSTELSAIREQFPILQQQVHGKPVAYLDSGATAQRPVAVLDADREFSETVNSAVHRGAHSLAESATEAYEQARTGVAAFVGRAAEELVWTRNATEGLNLLAYGLSSGTGEFALRPGTEVVVTEMEHHANLVPWQQACQRSGATLRWIPVTDEGRLDLDAAHQVISPNTAVVAFAHVSNVLGTVNPVAQLVELAHTNGALAVLDACQSVPHQSVHLAELGVDYAVFSAHKMCGPTGIGAVAASARVLESLPPFLTGGSMVAEVTMDNATFREPPQRFEAGTPPVSQAVAWHAAVRYLQKVGMSAVAEHEHHLTQRLLAGIAEIPGVRVLGPTELKDRSGSVSVVVEGVHPHDVGQFVDNDGIAVRVGHHCAQPIHRRFGATASTRASVYLYNTETEIDRYLESLGRVRDYFVRS